MKDSFLLSRKKSNLHWKLKSQKVESSKPKRLPPALHFQQQDTTCWPKCWISIAHMVGMESQKKNSDEVLSASQITNMLLWFIRRGQSRFSLVGSEWWRYAGTQMDISCRPNCFGCSALLPKSSPSLLHKCPFVSQYIPFVFFSCNWQIRCLWSLSQLHVRWSFHISHFQLEKWYEPTDTFPGSLLDAQIHFNLNSDFICYDIFLDVNVLPYGGNWGMSN